MDGFNSRAHEGRDRGGLVGVGVKDIVSIHAPTRGATPAIAIAASATGFNSRAHEGRDLSQSSPSVLG